MLRHGIFKCSQRVVANAFEVFQASSQNIDRFDAALRLYPEMHFVLLRMWNRVAAEADVGAKIKKTNIKFLMIRNNLMWNKKSKGFQIVLKLSIRFIGEVA